LELNVRRSMQIDHVLKIELSYMLGGIILDRVDSIIDLGVIMESKMSFTGHIDVTVGKALAMLGFVKKFSCEFRGRYTLRTLYVSLVRPKLEYSVVCGGLSMEHTSIELCVCKGSS
jgi:hypothetical protein